MKRFVATLFLLAIAPSARADFVAFRLTDLDLRDPHVYARLPLFGCEDITDSVPLGLSDPFNETLEEAITTDTDLDGNLDLNGLIVFLDTQVAVGMGPSPNGSLGGAFGESGDLVVHFGSCTAPMNGTMCIPDLSNPIQRTTYTNTTTGDCLQPYAGTTFPYSPAITTPGSPCFTTDLFGLMLDLAGIQVELEDAQISGTYFGSPPSLIVDGLITGFLRQAVADTVIIPPDVSHVGGEPLSAVLPGGADCCAAHDDRDLGRDGTTVGWWAYFNFEAVVVMMDASTGAGLAPRPVGAGLRLGPPVPNPFFFDTTLSYVLPRSGPVRITVLDAAGRRVATLLDAPMTAGIHLVTWHGTNAGGRAVGSGVYFVRLETVNGGKTRKVVLTH
jgi:hypothetical protein